MSTRTLAVLISSSSKHCLHRNVTLPLMALCYYRDSVTIILTASSLETYVMSRAVTEDWLSRIVTGWWPGFKNAKIDPVWPFYLALLSNFAMGKPTRSTKNEPLVFKYLLNLCVSKLEVFKQLPPAYHENSGNSMVSCRDFLYMF